MTDDVIKGSIITAVTERAELTRPLPLDQCPLPAHRRRAQGDDTADGGD